MNFVFFFKFQNLNESNWSYFWVFCNRYKILVYTTAENVYNICITFLNYIKMWYQTFVTQ